MENINAMAKMLASNIQKDKFFYKHNNLIICGENGEGKTTLIRKLINELQQQESCDFYYIDLNNRMIYDPNNTAAKSLDQMSLRSIVDNRMKEVNFTVKDVFEDMSPGAAVVYKTIIDDFERYRSLFEEILDIKLFLHTDKDSWNISEILCNDGIELNKLATSEAARMRLLFEIDNAVRKGAKTIIIDEFDTYLSEDTTSTFLTALSDKYNGTSLVLSIHTLTAMLPLSGFDVAMICETNSNIEENKVRLLDVDSINELGQIEKLKRLFERITRVNELEEIVSRLVDTGEIKDSDIQYIQVICRDDLTGREKILYDYVKEVL